MSRTFPLAAALALALSLSSVAAAPGAAAEERDAEDRWRPLVEHTLKKNRGEKKYMVGWELSRGLRAIRFEVEGSPVEILRVEVAYAKGKSAVWTPEQLVGDQEVSDTFELDTSLGYIVKLYLEYRLQPEERTDRYENKLKSDVILAGLR